MQRRGKRKEEKDAETDQILRLLNFVLRQASVWLLREVTLALFAALGATLCVISLSGLRDPC